MSILYKISAEKESVSKDLFGILRFFHPVFPKTLLIESFSPVFETSAPYAVGRHAASKNRRAVTHLSAEGGVSSPHLMPLMAS